MADAYRVFISWSGEPSKSIALRLRDLIKPIIPTAKMFVSVDSIVPGTRWSPEVTDALRQCTAGIAIVTPTNLDAEWLHFECGAISNQAEDRARVLPLLCGVAEGDLRESPLNHFQHRPLDREGVLSAVKLVRDVTEPSYENAELEHSFDVWWEKGGPDLLAAAAVPGAAALPAQLDINDLAARIDQLWSAVQALLLEQGRQTSAIDTISRRLPSPIYLTGAGGAAGITLLGGAVSHALSGISFATSTDAERPVMFESVRTSKRPVPETASDPEPEGEGDLLPDDGDD